MPSTMKDVQQTEHDSCRFSFGQSRGNGGACGEKSSFYRTIEVTREDEIDDGLNIEDGVQLGDEVRFTSQGKSIIDHPMDSFIKARERYVK